MAIAYSQSIPDSVLNSLTRVFEDEIESVCIKRQDEVVATFSRKSFNTYGTYTFVCEPRPARCYYFGDGMVQLCNSRVDWLMKTPFTDDPEKLLKERDTLLIPSVIMDCAHEMQIQVERKNFSVLGIVLSMFTRIDVIGYWFERVPNTWTWRNGRVMLVLKNCMFGVVVGDYVVDGWFVTAREALRNALDKTEMMSRALRAVATMKAG
jgi:hypothetical protein